MMHRARCASNWPSCGSVIELRTANAELREQLTAGHVTATWECKYHVVFTPKYRKKLLSAK
jgi:hypothetical protein